MKPLLRLSVLLFAAVFTSVLNAQTQTDLMISPQTNEIIPPAPSSAQQMRYQSPQPSLATGAVSLSIPLYTLEVEGVSIPFTMAYQTSGIKPLDDSFPCGYGWSLQPALRVTRTVRGRPDELFAYKGEEIANRQLQSDPAMGYACMVANNFHSGASVRTFYDAEKDIFTISLPTGTYTRIIDKDAAGNIKFLGSECDDEVVISSSGTLSEIKAIDAQGIIYRFGGSFTESPEHSGLDMTNYVTSWGLKEIELPSGRKITFDWKIFHRHEKKIYGGDSFGDMFDNGYPELNSETVRSEALYALPSGIRGNYTKRMHLSEVSFPGGRIAIAYQDTIMSSFATIAGADTVRLVKFGYGSGKIENKFLRELTVSGEGTYKFDYDPQRFESVRQWHRVDWWGYYNGREPYGGPGNICLTPRIRLKTQRYSGNTSATYEWVGHADRRPDEDVMKAGILTRVTYPTGGSSSFEYEAHRFPAMKADSQGNIDSTSDPMLDMGGGLRVKKITTRSSSSDAAPHVRTFVYDSIKVTAVPSAATFVSVTNALGIVYPIAHTVSSHIYRRTSVNHSSDYMDNHIGENDIWYSKVTELCPEGKTEYHFSRIIPPSVEVRQWGLLYPREINNVFSHGPSLTRKTVYKLSGGTYKPVETTTFEYVRTGWESVENARISRFLIQAAVPSTQAPDFTDGVKFQRREYADNPVLVYYEDVTLTQGGFLVSNGGSTYRIDCYTLNRISERLRSKTVTQHFDNGDFSQTETYSYKPGTSIVTSVATTTSGDTRTDRIELEYAVSGRNSAETAMVNANAIGIPVKTTRTFGTAVTAVRREMKNYSNRIFRPAKEWLSRGSVEWLAGQYGYDSFGNIREYRGTDSVPSVFLWGYDGRHPVYRIDGASYSEVHAKGIGTDAIKGSAEKTNILPKLSGWLVTRALWRPLVGVTSLRQPSGLTSSYTYDSAGRLTQTAIEGHGPMEQYNYHINDNGRNYIRHGVFEAADDKWAMPREIINYDGLGRETSRLRRFPGTPRLVVVDKPVALADIDMPSTSILLRMGYTAQLTEYDSSDRPCRTWSPVRVNDMHPTSALIKDAAKSHYGTDYAYSSTFYEASPRGLVSAMRKAGAEWHDADRRVTVRTFTNTSSGDYCCYEYYPASETSQTLSRRLYPSGTLTVEETIDEEGHRTLVFKDCRGLTVMTREGERGDWHDTRYVYNDFGDLMFVIQPNHPLGSAPVNTGYCFRYNYDGRGRLIFKALPQCEGMTYYYDSRSRLFAEQDGNMRSEGRFLLHFYDRYGRQVLSSFATAAESAIKPLCAKSFTVSPPVMATVLCTPWGGYYMPDRNLLTLTECVSATYYDNYDFSYDFNSGWDYYTPPAGHASPTQNVRGMVTGSLQGRYLSVFSYDSAGRMIRTASGSWSGEIESANALRLDYEGKVIEEQREDWTGTQKLTRSVSRSYFDSGHPWTVRVVQNGDSTRIAYEYDDAGLLSKVTYGSDIDHTMTYNANGWLTSWTVDAPVKNVGTPMQLEPIVHNTSKTQIKVSVASETLHYSDAGSDYTARYDGRISSRKRGSDLTAYTYDIHGRLTEAATVTTATDGRDYSAFYSYDMNCNLLSYERHGIIDVRPGETYSYGEHFSVNNVYDSNRLDFSMVSYSGSDYEGRTGVLSNGYCRYDANGNIVKDTRRGILLIKYNHLNLPVDIYFNTGQRQTISYDGSGRKRSVEYSQSPSSIVNNELPDDGDYVVTSTRTYVGPHIFTDGALEYSSFEGGYIDPAKGVMYYITDWQGNNAAVMSKSGDIVQSTTYYPYGEPTIEPRGQRFLFGGKEREHAAGRNSYDFGARNLAANAWTTPDPFAEKFYHISPYSYCGGDPINHVDPDGKRQWPVPILYNGEPAVHSNDFGVIRQKSNHPHGGVDINIGSGDFDKGAPVYATHDGKITRIVRSEDGNAGGLRIQITSSNNRVSTFYMHLESISDGLELYQSVSEGQQIGSVGDTGQNESRKWNAHLHYELSVDNKKINPADKNGNLRDPQKIIGGDNKMYYAPPLAPLIVVSTIQPKMKKIKLFDININNNPIQTIYLEKNEDQ